jgi:hypothetical protein
MQSPTKPIKSTVKGYAYIWEALSSESIARLRQEANFRTTVEESKHVYGLLQTIHKTHTLGLDPARSDEEQWYLIERRIFNLQQKEKETAVEFATRWENMIREMQSMFRDRALKEREKENDAIRDKLLEEGPLSRDNFNFLVRKRKCDVETVNNLQYLSEEQMAIRYLYALDKKYWGSMMVDLKNDQLMGKDSFPKTLEKAAKLASQWHVENNKGAGKDKVALAAQAKLERGAKGPCFHCGGDHLIKDCQAKKAGKPKTYNVAEEGAAVKAAAAAAKSTQQAAAAKAAASSTSTSTTHEKGMYCHHCKEKTHNTKQHEEYTSKTKAASSAAAIATYEGDDESTESAAFSILAFTLPEEEPAKVEQIEESGNIKKICLAVQSKMVNKWTILLDTCSMVTLIKNSALLEDISTVENGLRLMGVHSDQRIIKEKGYTKYYGRVWHYPDAVANIVGLVTIEQQAVDMAQNFRKDFRVIFHDGTVWRDTRYHSHSHSYMHWKGGMGNCNYPVGRRCV